MSALIPYQKPYLTSQALCAKLTHDGLTIENLELACRTLESCSYYRFKAYLIPLKDAQGKYYQGASFEQALRLYDFDEKLRGLLFRFIQQTEIALRSSFDSWMTNECSGNAFWYLDASLFDDKDKHSKTVISVAGSFRCSKEIFATHFRQKYYNEFCSFYRDLPPGWVAMELLTFGQFKSLIEAISSQTEYDKKLNRFSRKVLNIKDFSMLKSWLNVILQVRNISCHHSRLFNRNLPAPANFRIYLDKEIPLVKVAGSSQPQINRIYSALVVIQHLFKSLGFYSIGPEILKLINDYPEINLHLPSMGFPARWQEEAHFDF